MKITFLVFNFGGGLVSALGPVMNGLVQRGHKVTLLCGRLPDAGRSALSDAVHMKELEVNRVAVMWSGIVAHLRTGTPDVMVSATPGVNALSILASKVFGDSVPVIATQHVHFSEGLRRRRLVDRCALRVAVRWSYGHAHKVVCVSRGVERDIQEVAALDSRSTRTIHNGVLTPDSADRYQADPPHPWFHDEGPPIVLGVGRLTPQKDFQTLISAYAQLSTELSARLLILGEGPCRKSLESQVANLGLDHRRVSLPGFVSNPLPFFRKASVFCLSSKWEGFGNVLVEALGAGVPIVSTDCPSGPREILEGGRWGVLVPPEAPLDMAKALSEQLMDPPNMSDARARAWERFGQEVMLEGYLRELEEILVSASPS